MFADKVYHLSPDSAPKSVLSQIADNMSAPEYMEMYETDRFYAVHMEYQFNYKLGDVVGMYFLISALSAFRDVDNPEHTRIYNTDRKLLFDEFDKIEGAEKLKSEVDLVDERLHSGMPLFPGKIFRIVPQYFKVAKPLPLIVLIKICTLPDSPQVKEISKKILIKLNKIIFWATPLSPIVLIIYQLTKKACRRAKSCK